MTDTRNSGGGALTAGFISTVSMIAALVALALSMGGYGNLAGDVWLLLSAGALVVGAAAVILGAVAWKRRKSRSGRRGMILGIVGVAGVFVGAIAFLAFLTNLLATGH